MFSLEEASAYRAQLSAFQSPGRIVDPAGQAGAVHGEMPVGGPIPAARGSGGVLPGPTPGRGPFFGRVAEVLLGGSMEGAVAVDFWTGGWFGWEAAPWMAGLRPPTPTSHNPCD